MNSKDVSWVNSLIIVKASVDLTSTADITAEQAKAILDKSFKAEQAKAILDKSFKKED
jgi:hypothetical protein